MVVATIAGVVACALTLWGGAALFEAFGIARPLAEAAAAVSKVLVLSVPLHLAYCASAFFCEAIQQPLASTVVMWLANVINLVFNLLWVGEYGALGSAYATLVARGFLAMSLGAWLLYTREARVYGTRRASDGPSYGALLRVGAAAAVSQAAEAGAFSGMTVIAGRLGERAVSAYQVCLNLLSVLFMVALGVATATAVLTSEAVGRARPDDAARASFLGLKTITLFMLGAGAFVTLAAPSVAHVYTNDAELLPLLIALLPWAALACVPDAAQAVVAGGLRALGDNWLPTASHVVAYALVMPALGLYFAETRALGVAGLLAAVTAASVLSAAVLTLRLRAVTRFPSPPV
jgi:MATE family multidrug resistance protein